METVYCDREDCNYCKEGECQRTSIKIAKFYMDMAVCKSKEIKPQKEGDKNE